jgi:hypothetical protein
VMQLKDSLGLAPEQLAKLQPLSDSLAARNAALGAEVRKIMADGGANPDMGALFAKVRPIMEKVQTQNAATMREVEKILTSEQWAKVPERIKRGQLGPGGGQGPAQRRRPPGDPR